MATYQGGCHCGNVRYEVQADLSSGVMSCNCSICQKKGHLLTFVPEGQFKLLKGESALGDYQFNKKVIHHLFCKTCGVGSFARGKGPDGKVMCAVNVRCLDGVDLGGLTVKEIDGRSF
jgi:hypothetical protein